MTQFASLAEMSAKLIPVLEEREAEEELPPPNPPTPEEIEEMKRSWERAHFQME